MLKEVKEENISALKLELAKAASLVITDFRGITEIGRASCRERV